MVMKWSNHINNPSSRFLVPINLGVEPKIMYLAHYYDIARLVAAILYLYV